MGVYLPVQNTKRRKWVVRIVTDPARSKALDGLIQVLSTMGPVQVHRHNTDVRGAGSCFDLVPANGMDSGAWSDEVAGLLVGFGWNAVRAPAFGEGVQYEEES